MKFDVRKRKLKQVIKYYDIEIAKFNYIYNAKITPKEGLRIVDLIKKKFKVNVRDIDFDLKMKNYGGFARYDGSLTFKKKKLNIYIICHEMAHLISYKTNTHGHNYIFAKNMAQVVDYVIKNIEFKMIIKK